MADDKGYYANIDDYYDKIHRTTWIRRSAGTMTGATMGVMYGAVIGTIAAFLPYALSAMGVAGAAAGVAAPSFAAIGSSIALFSAAAGLLGMVFASEVATHTASTAAGLEEKEKREKLEKQVDGVVASRAPASVSGKEPPLFNWKISLVTTPLFAAFGALLALNPHTSALVLEKAVFPNLIDTGSTAAIATSTIIFGMFGSVFACKNSLISNKLTNFYYKALSDQLFTRSPEKSPVVVPEKTQEIASQGQELAMEPSNGKSFAASRVRFSLQGLIEKNEKPEPTIITR